MKPIFCTLLAAIYVITGTPTTQANPFDPQFTINVDDLCANGDLGLSIPVLRVRLDESTTLALRAEHVMRTGEYGYVQSEIILRPLFTSLAPYDRDALLWRKPDGTELKLVKASPAQKIPLPAIPEDIASQLAARPHIVYTNRNSPNVIAWASTEPGEFKFIYTENFFFCYKNGLLDWFTPPSGSKVTATTKGNCITQLRIGETTIWELVPLTEHDIRIKTAGQQVIICKNDQNRIVSIARDQGLEIAQFDYDNQGFLAFAKYKNIKHHYTWDKTQRPTPAIIDWVKPYHIQSVDDKNYAYNVTNDTITMSIKSPHVPQKTTTLRVRYGTILSLTEKK